MQKGPRTARTLVTAGFAFLTQISATGDYVGIAPGMVLWSLGASIGFPASTSLRSPAPGLVKKDLLPG